MSRVLRMGLAAFILFAGWVGQAIASEGTALLSGKESEARCFIASVLVGEGRYKLVVTCRDLVVPPASETLFYHAWAKRLGEPTASPAGGAGTSFFRRSAYFSLGDLTGGKLAADSRDPFDEVVVTAEKEQNPREPNLERVVVDGTIRPIEFGGAVVAEPTREEVARVTMVPTVSPTPVAGGRSVAATAFRVFFIILLVIVAVAVVISVIQRRSASR